MIKANVFALTLGACALTSCATVSGTSPHPLKSSAKANLGVPKASPLLTGYQKSASDAVLSEWSSRVKAAKNLRDGRVSIKFTINARGEVIYSKVVSKTGDRQLIALCQSAILKAKFPPLSENLQKEIKNNMITIVYNFTVE